MAEDDILQPGLTSITRPPPSQTANEALDINKRGSSEKTRVGNREVVVNLSGSGKRGRGRPRLTEEEKQRRKELREIGLIKRSKRRTKEG